MLILMTDPPSQRLRDVSDTQRQSIEIMPCECHVMKYLSRFIIIIIIIIIIIVVIFCFSP